MEERGERREERGERGEERGERREERGEGGERREKRGERREERGGRREEGGGRREDGFFFYNPSAMRSTVARPPHRLVLFFSCGENCPWLTLTLTLLGTNCS